MTLNNIIKRLLAISLGLAFTAADGVNTLKQAIESGTTPDVVITIGVIVIGMSLSLPIAVWSFTNQNKAYGSLAAIVFVGCWAVSYGYSLDRLGTNRMNQQHKVAVDNMAGLIAAENLIAARKKLDNANAVLAREEVTGRGPKWKEAYNLKQQAEEEVAKAERRSVPMKRSETFEYTSYLVYAVPFVAQAAGVVFLLIGFGALDKNKQPIKRDVIQELIEQPIRFDISRDNENAVFEYLKSISEKGAWHTTYRKIGKATGVNIALVKEHLTDLHYRQAIAIDGMSKGRGTWGRIGAKTLIEI